MKSYYNICFASCVTQLIGWLCLPYVGIGGIIRKITSVGFYGNMYSETPNREVADIWGISVGSAGVINKGIAILYFLSIIVVVGSFFVRKRFDFEKLTGVVFYLTIFSLMIILGLPIGFS